jgi:hypothetical protein
MNKKFIITGLVTTVINFLLNAGAYAFFLKGFYQSHPVISEEFMKQLHRPPNELIIWAMVVTSLAIGFIITTVMKWSGATTFASGLKNGFIFAFLFWSAVNFGLYASSNFFSQSSVFADLACSVTAMTISAVVAAWMLGRGQNKEAV